MAPKTLLQWLQFRTLVDCDTMDIEVPQALGPFVDCTSNQVSKAAIAYFELEKPKNQKLIQESVALSKKLASTYPDVLPKVLAGEIAMVMLQHGISKHITGFVHIQTNPYHSYNTLSTIADAHRIVQLFKIIDQNFDTKRICIKIPSTWEGLQACKILEASGVSTLATTLFTIEQAALAGEVGCRYIAPYVNELKVHFEPGFVDNNKAQLLCLQAQRYYEAHNITTQVLPASLTSTQEIMELAGVHHITIAPWLLQELAETPVEGNQVASLFDGSPLEVRKLLNFGSDEKGYRLAFTLSAAGEGERKLGQAINIFCGMQTKLEALMA
ncbi:Transaldolase [Lachnellula suecica]|uniref:Transaldolase n=1 Tax=Lachnellula suecica TaxID=602035 RepID=A0A8T9C3H6_9HELO|nr:Transaldolase [Lachnellula suecica]